MTQRITRVIQIRPLDPVIVRDGRPFGEIPGIVAHSMDELSPGMVAGTIRTVLAKHAKDVGAAGSIPKKQMNQFVKAVVRGPFYQWRDEIFFPLPQDMHIRMNDGKLHVNKLRPKKPDKPSDVQGFFGTHKDGQHEDVLWPVRIGRDGKLPSRMPSYLSAGQMLKWLTDSLPVESLAGALQDYADAGNARTVLEGGGAPCFLPAFPKDVRTHTAIDPGSYTVKDQALYATEALVVPEDAVFLAAVDVEASDPVNRLWPEALSALHSLGGKRRLAHFSETKRQSFLQCPEPFRLALEKKWRDQLERQGTRYVRLVLATPAYFEKGWYPRWLDQNLEGQLGNVKLRLRWACVSRWQPVSGWSYAERAEKCVRRMVPAGSVYFFEVIEGDPGELIRDRWLVSVSDANRRMFAFDHEDGFGLALWGIWDPVAPTEDHRPGRRTDDER